MTKKTGILIIAVALFTNSYAQRLEESKVPASAKRTFNQQFPGVAGKWGKENGNYEVNFKKDGKFMSMVIDAAGNIVETETAILVNQLPAGVEAYIKAHYKGSVIKEAAQIVKANGVTVYEAEVNRKDILFDANGKWIGEAKD